MKEENKYLKFLCNLLLEILKRKLGPLGGSGRNEKMGRVSRGIY